ncbi:PTS system cellobiose-specific IIB component [Spiroplasma clarkii]|uniref:PTS system, cellobiose-specific IIB component n=1 Tax=Spiroplasma clarkii TaxID=2139 RepID=A0A1Y0L1M3_9MOLU|nr:PTS sugar transporter subunit IIB [Spiroplasma clarkii]ARU91680.1 PTS system cellobiose-specific IIB component [Spiroplasma clarkii]ATX71070.1 PTS system, cellobiose-specific IIB component [Spiroplasma clarkii]
MIKILLCCSAGMSTSLLVNKMLSYTGMNGIDCIVEAVPVSEAKQMLSEWDVILVGPQVTYALTELKQMTKKPVAVIPPQIYATAKGKETVELAVKLYNDSKL